MAPEPTAAPAPTTGAPTVPAKIRTALTRFRVAAFVVGWGLIVLVALMILKYGFGGDTGRFDWTVTVWGPIHGVLFAIYVLLTFDLAYKDRWSLWGIVKVIASGLVPGISFVAERWVHKKVLAREKI